MTPILEADDLHVWFDRERGPRLHVLRGVSFTLDAGEAIGLAGESGCGKTTAILATMGLLPPSATVAGEIRLDGENVLGEGEASARRHRWKDIAMVFQGAMNAFSPVTPIGAQIAEPMKLHGVADGREARRRVGDLLEMVGIAPDRGNRYPHEFSGGMRQRAAIAMALACEPKVLLADEPTTALDVIVQAQVLRLLERLRDELGLALVLVTHDLPVIAQVCERAAVMYAGRIVESGSTDTLFREPGHPYTRRLLEATPNLQAGRRVSSIPGTPPRLEVDWPGCSFAPRCDRAFEPCQSSRPRTLVVDAGHKSECHLHDPRVAGGP